jgi:hypothetical protein
MSPALKKTFIIIFVLHLFAITSVIITLYALDVDPKVLDILIYYLASFIAVYITSILCYFYVTREGRDIGPIF